MERLVSFLRSTDDLFQSAVNRVVFFLKRQTGMRLSTLLYLFQAIQIVCALAVGIAVWQIESQRWVSYLMAIVVIAGLWQQRREHKRLLAAEDAGSSEAPNDNRFAFNKLLFFGLLVRDILRETRVLAKSELKDMLPSEQRWSIFSDYWLIAFIVAGLLEYYLLRCPLKPPADAASK